MRSARARRVAGLSCALALASCQSYQAEPIEPRVVVMVNPRFTIIGRQLSPNLMLVVDTSFSMTDSTLGDGGPCAAGGVYLPGSPNACKWKDLLDAFVRPGGFLDNLDGVSQTGLLTFPSDKACGPGRIHVPVGDRTATAIKQALGAMGPDGQTPTAVSLDVVLQDPAMLQFEEGRRRYVMLLTDGGPNCNLGMADRCQACQANAAVCYAPDGCQPTFMGPGCVDPTACLDEEATVAAVQRLREQGVLTLVVGFGRDTATAFAARVLNRAAVAGGEPRQGGDTSYYQANSAEQLQQILEELRGLLQNCDFALDPPVASAELAEASLFDLRAGLDLPLERGADWDFAPDPAGQPDPSRIRLLGSRCSQVQEAEANTFEVRVRYLGSL